jgi:hypothetical protein
LITVLWAMRAHAASEDQMTAQRMITGAWPALADTCIAPIAQRLSDGKLDAWCRNGASEARADRTIFSSVSNRPV